MNVVFLSYLVCTKLSASVFILFKDVEYGDYLTPTTTTTTTPTRRRPKVSLVRIGLLEPSVYSRPNPAVFWSISSLSIPMIRYCCDIPECSWIGAELILGFRLLITDKSSL